MQRSPETKNIENHCNLSSLRKHHYYKCCLKSANETGKRVSFIILGSLSECNNLLLFTNATKFIVLYAILPSHLIYALTQNIYQHYFSGNENLRKNFKNKVKHVSFILRAVFTPSLFLRYTNLPLQMTFLNNLYNIHFSCVTFPMYK